MFPKLSIIVMFMSFLTTLGLQCPFAQKNDYNTLDKNFSKKHTGRTSSPSPTRVELHTLTSARESGEWCKTVPQYFPFGIFERLSQVFLSFDFKSPYPFSFFKNFGREKMGSNRIIKPLNKE